MDDSQALADHLATVLASCALPAKPHLVIAVSGGGDSMALALLMQDWAKANNATLTALTVDHGLRAESADEAKTVGGWLKSYGIAHHILTPRPLELIANIQNRAREMRYGVLTAWCREHKADGLLIAHHAEDQAETVALQQHRGTTPPSRAGMALVITRADVRVIRPLLGVRKAQLLAYLKTKKQPWLEDPSNASDKYARNRVRKEMDDETVITLWNDAQTQGALRHQDDLTHNSWIKTYVSEDGQGLLIDTDALRALPDTQRTDLLSRAIRAVGGKTHRARAQETQRLDARLKAHNTGKATLGKCVLQWKPGTRLHITPEAPLEAGRKTPHIPAENPLKLLASEPFWWFNLRPLF